MTALTTGQRVRVRWSGKTGIVTDSQLRHHPDGTPSALVLLDPFVARWHDTRPSCVTTLEVIYATEDLEGLCPTR
jgi:hypothetical protein